MEFKIGFTEWFFKQANKKASEFWSCWKKQAFGSLMHQLKLLFQNVLLLYGRVMCIILFHWNLNTFDLMGGGSGWNILIFSYPTRTWLSQTDCCLSQPQAIEEEVVQVSTLTNYLWLGLLYLVWSGRRREKGIVFKGLGTWPKYLAIASHYLRPKG